MSLCITGCEQSESSRYAGRNEAEDSADTSKQSFLIDLDRSSAGYGDIEIAGIDPTLIRAAVSVDDWKPYFWTYVQESWLADSTLPVMLGQYQPGVASIRFSPRFPLEEGQTYHVFFDEVRLRKDLALADRKGAVVMDTVFSVPEAETGDLAVVSHIFPSADSLPANLLKLYIQFSRPMSEGMAYEHILLVDEATETTVEAPFVEVVPELWDPDRTRFTLLFDPGRIKRFVGPNLELGPPLSVGKSYRLVVDRGWEDADGRALGESFEKRFSVTETDRRQPDMAQWRIDPPAAGSREELVVTFPEPMDAALLQRLITAHSDMGEPLEGRISIRDAEHSWMFTPDEPWQKGIYRIEVATIIEDLAGNTLQSLFDVDLGDAPDSEIREAQTVASMRFVVE